VQALLAEVARLKSENYPALEADKKTPSNELEQALGGDSQPPLDDCRTADEHGNVEHIASGQNAINARAPSRHFELGLKRFGQMDFENRCQAVGARFVVLKAASARLEARASGNASLTFQRMSMDITDCQSPLLVRNDAMFGTNAICQSSR